MTKKFHKLKIFLSVVGALSMTSLVAGCKPRKEQASSLEGAVPIENLPPKVAYHFGMYKFLYNFARPSSYNAAEWALIPSVKTPPGGAYRRGIYISQHPAYNESYAQENLANPKMESPWVMTVRIKDECRGRERTFNLLTTTLVPQCPGYLYSLASRAGLNQFCIDTANNHLFKNKAGVVVDTWWPEKGFWYVYDPKCIEALDGTSESIMKLAADVPELWKMAPYTTEERRDRVAAELGYGPGQVMFTILARAMNDVALDDMEQLAKIAVNGRASDIPELKAAVKSLTLMALKCAQSEHVSDFKAQLQLFLSKIDAQILKKQWITSAAHIDDFTRNGLRQLDTVCKDGAPKIEKVPLTLSEAEQRTMTTALGVGNLRYLPANLVNALQDPVLFTTLKLETVTWYYLTTDPRDGKSPNEIDWPEVPLARAVEFCASHSPKDPVPSHVPTMQQFSAWYLHRRYVRKLELGRQPSGSMRRFWVQDVDGPKIVTPMTGDVEVVPESAQSFASAVIICAKD